MEQRAKRFNQGKPRWGLVDFDSLLPLVRALEYGENKYGPYNWKKGRPYVETCESLLKHVFKFLSGENVDLESGESHLGLAMANLMFLSYYQDNNMNDLLDDRNNPWKCLVEEQLSPEEVECLTKRKGNTAVSDNSPSKRMSAIKIEEMFNSVKEGNYVDVESFLNFCGINGKAYLRTPGENNIKLNKERDLDIPEWLGGGEILSIDFDKNYPHTKLSTDSFYRFLLGLERRDVLENKHPGIKIEKKR